MIPMQIEKTYTTLLKNRLYRRIDGFHCLLCNVVLADDKDAYNHITNNEKHAEHMSCELIENLRIDDDKSVELVNNGITLISGKGYECTFCSCLVPNLDHVPEHIYSKKHKLQCQIVSTFNFCNGSSSTLKDQEEIKNINDEECDQNKDERNSFIIQNDRGQSPNNDLHNQNHNQVQLSCLSPKNPSIDNNFIDQAGEEEKDWYIDEDVRHYSIESIDNLKHNSAGNDEYENANNFHGDQIDYHLHLNPVHEYHESENELNSNDPVNNFGTIPCSICYEPLRSDPAFLYHRMFHLSQRTCVFNDIIHFFTKQNIRNIYCSVCDYSMQSEDDLERHLNDMLHQKRMLVLGCPNSNAVMNTTYSTMYPNFSVPTNNMYNTCNADFSRYVYYSGSQTQVSPGAPVHVEFNRDHPVMGMSAVLPVPQPFFNYPMLPTYICFVCCLQFSDENQLFSHYAYDQIHKYRMDAIQLIKNDANINFTTYMNMQVLKCSKCQIYLTEVNMAVYHMFEMQHITNHKDNYDTALNYVEEENYACPICKVNTSYDTMMVEHLESDYHKNKVKDYYSNINCQTFEKVIFFCPMCKMNFFNDSILLEHFYVVHEKGCDNPVQNNIPSQNDVQCVSMCNNVGNEVEQYDLNQEISHEVDSIVDNTNNSNLMQNYQLQTTKQKLEISNQKELETVNENFGAYTKTTMIRTKNLLNFSPRYVKLCVETGQENIFKINPEKIKKLHLSISLTFPYNSKRVCIPCGCELSKTPQLLYEHLRTEEHEKNLQEMEDYDELFENYREQFSDLELAKQYICEDSEEWVMCYACDSKVENSNLSISSHIESELHRDNHLLWKQSAEKISIFFNDIFENIWYFIEKFFCNICCSQFDFEVDYARHLENQKHLMEVEKRILKRQSLQFDCCIICSSYWYGKSDHHKIHCSKDSHKYILISRDFNVPKMPEAAMNILSLIDDTIENLMKESDEVIDSKGVTEAKLLESVEDVVRSKYPNAKAHLFGSRTLYLALKDSDLDIYLDCENHYEKLNSIDECQEQLLVVQECFHKYQDIWVIEEILVRTRVPIIKVRHRHTNLKCDISFINGLSVEKSKILSYYINACSPCRKLILYLKKWSTLCRLSITRGLTTFAMAWLVIFYLQVEGILPSVWHLIKLNNHSNIVAGWETGIFKVVPVKSTDLTITELIQGFFSYYAEFDYISNVACPFLGRIMKKSQFSHIDDLPEEMSLYKSQIKDERIEFFRLDSPMCIQEPIDLSQNLTKAVSKLHLRMFKYYCADSAMFLRKEIE